MFTKSTQKTAQALLIAPVISAICIGSALADDVKTVDKDTSDAGRPPSAATETQKHQAKETAKVVNQIPGGKIAPKDLEPPSTAPIKGFHPIKKMLKPITDLQAMTVKLQQQIMKLEAPIAGLQPPMLGLQKKMTGVDEHIGGMQTRLDKMQTEVVGVREDLAAMRKDINQLKTPIQSLEKPISGVARPLEQVQQQLNLVLLAIMAAAVAISVGTPLAAILIYKNRQRLFPDMSKHDLPEVKETAASARR